MITKYPRPVEEAMRYTCSTLNERQRRLFAASEALKLGHGGIVYIAQLLDCHRRSPSGGVHLESRVATGDHSRDGAEGSVREITPCLGATSSTSAGTPSSTSSAEAA